jgi:hypothetical protein
LGGQDAVERGPVDAELSETEDAVKHRRRPLTERLVPSVHRGNPVVAVCC